MTNENNLKKMNYDMTYCVDSKGFEICKRCKRNLYLYEIKGKYWIMYPKIENGYCADFWEGI